MLDTTAYVWTSQVGCELLSYWHELLSAGVANMWFVLQETYNSATTYLQQSWDKLKAKAEL